MDKAPSRLLVFVALLVVLAAASLALVQYAREWSPSAKAKKMKNPFPATPAALAAAKQSYVEHCQSCHGENGDGKGQKAAELSVAPMDFAKAREMRELADGQLFQEITKGQLPMPAFEDKLSEQERWQLVDYVRTFASKAAAAP
jgi:mono/diheme cytochrome c family protein